MKIGKLGSTPSSDKLSTCDLCNLISLGPKYEMNGLSPKLILKNLPHLGKAKWEWALVWLNIEN